MSHLPPPGHSTSQYSHHQQPQQQLHHTSQQDEFSSESGRSTQTIGGLGGQRPQTTTPQSQEKKRPSRAGTRSVSTLTQAQLERKRANDREAQRAIRQRTKDHIDKLEKRIADLTANGDPTEKLSALMQRNQELEQEVAVLRSRLGHAANALGCPESALGTDAVHLPSGQNSPNERMAMLNQPRPESAPIPMSAPVSSAHSASIVKVEQWQHHNAYSPAVASPMEAPITVHHALPPAPAPPAPPATSARPTWAGAAPHYHQTPPPTSEPSLHALDTGVPPPMNYGYQGQPMYRSDPQAQTQQQPMAYPPPPPPPSYGQEYQQRQMDQRLTPQQLTPQQHSAPPPPPIGPYCAMPQQPTYQTTAQQPTYQPPPQQPTYQQPLTPQSQQQQPYQQTLQPLQQGQHYLPAPTSQQQEQLPIMSRTPIDDRHYTYPMMSNQ